MDTNEREEDLYWCLTPAREPRALQAFSNRSDQGGIAATEKG